MKSAIRMLFTICLFQMALVGCNESNSERFKREKQLEREQFAKLLEEHGEDLNKEIDRIAGLASLLEGEVPALSNEANLAIHKSKSGNTIVELRRGLEQLADPDVDAASASDIYVPDAGGLRPLLRPTFFFSGLAELRAGLDGPKDRQSPATLLATLATLKRLEYLVVISGYVRQPDVLKPGDRVPGERHGFGPTRRVDEITHINGSAEVTAVLIDVKNAKLMGAVSFAAENKSYETRLGEAAYKIEEEMKSELKTKLEHGMQAALETLANGGEVTNTESKSVPYSVEPLVGQLPPLSPLSSSDR